MNKFERLLYKLFGRSDKTIEEIIAIRTLQSMSDRELNDIGVSRGEIAYRVRGKN